VTRTHTSSTFSPDEEDLIAASLERRNRDMVRRERFGHGLFAVGFLTAAGLFAALAPAERAFSPGLALALVLTYAVLASAEFSTGAGYAVPTQVVFVPMLLLAPTPLVPLLVAAGALVTSAAQVALGRLAPGRLLLAFADSWFALAPAAVLVAAGAQTPDWTDWPIYVLALAAQFLSDACISSARMYMALRIPPRQLLRELPKSYLVDLLLAPIGLLAAFAARDEPYAVLLLLPLAGLFLLAAAEREGRVERTLELSRAYRGTALLLRDVIEEDDEYTGQHTENVVELAVSVATELGVDDATRRDTELGALLHDVGKITMPKEIINKPGRLDEEEWSLMKTHTVEGERMLMQVGGALAHIGTIVRASHERWDGRGYPDGVAGEAIPLPALIVSACDAYSAMTTDRPYRPALSENAAQAEIRSVAGTQLAPPVAEALLRVVMRSG
jgi:putative nucleotidyltransferase with HDIG domain